MTNLLIIIWKVSLALAVFYIFYWLFLSKDKDFRRNRFYLLGASILSFVLPWITIPVIQARSQFLSIAYIAKGSQIDNQLVYNEVSTFTWPQLLTIIYITGITFSILKATLSYFNVYRIIRNALHIPLEKFKIVVTPLKLSPFSFFKWIVIPSHIHTSHPSYEKMVQHELVHCRQYHSVDLFIGELLVAFQWFNPFAWLIRKSISENLEYLVDDEMLKAGTNTKDYQYSLLSFSMVGLKPAVANNFNTNLLKKRIVMMNKNKYSEKYWFHNLLIPICLVLALVLTASFRKQLPENTSARKQINEYLANGNIAQTPAKTQDIQANRESKAEQPGLQENTKTPDVSYSAGKDVFLKYIAQNIRYPQIAAENNISGVVKVIVTFTPGNIQVKDFVKERGITEFEEIVVVGYGKQNTKQNQDAVDSGTSYLRNEVERVIKSFNDIPNDLSGKTFAASVKFEINGLKVIGYGEQPKELLNDNVKVLIEATNSTANKEPYYILNNEKIISKAEMEGIDPKSIESVQVIKADKIEHNKLGILNGSVIIITTAK